MFSVMQVGACVTGSWCFHPIGAGTLMELVLVKLGSWCSQQFVACETEVVSSQRVGAHKNNNVHKIKTTYCIKKKRFSPFMGFLRNICLCILHVRD